MKSVRLSQDAQLRRAELSSPVLVQGATGTGVANVQDLLASLGIKFLRSFAHGAADGIFGPETFAAVKQFQMKAGLKADGIIGPKTLAALDDAVLRDDRLERRTGPHKAGAGYW